MNVRVQGPLRRLGWRLALPAALMSAWTPAAAADIDLFTAETLSLSGDIRLIAADGENSWVDEGFGKLRASGDHGEIWVKPELGTADLVWKPRFGWAWSATVVATLQSGERNEIGISEAFLSFKPARSGKLRFSARAGLMWPPVSLEHEGADWHVRDTITPSAINSWIGEEVRPAAIEGSVSAELGNHRLTASAALMAANDTSGTLLAFRGWALHDRKTLAFNRQPLPPMPAGLEWLQPQFTHPLLDVDEGFAERPGYYAKVAWQPPLPVRLELFRYDNRADPEAVNEDVEWGWRTIFNHAAVIADLGASTELKLQALTGNTKMGFDEGEDIWVDADFRSAFALVSRPFGKTNLAARLDWFDVEQKGGLIGSDLDEKGWAAALAGRRDFGKHLTGLVELLHVSSSRDQRRDAGLSPRQRQTQIQADLRFRW